MATGPRLRLPPAVAAPACREAGGAWPSPAPEAADKDAHLQGCIGAQALSIKPLGPTPGPQAGAVGWVWGETGRTDSERQAKCSRTHGAPPPRHCSALLWEGAWGSGEGCTGVVDSAHTSAPSGKTGRLKADKHSRHRSDLECRHLSAPST